MDSEGEWETVSATLRHRRDEGKWTEERRFYSEAERTEYLGNCSESGKVRCDHVLPLLAHRQWEQDCFFFLGLEYADFQAGLERLHAEKMRAGLLWTEHEVLGLIRDVSAGLQSLSSSQFTVDVNPRTIVRSESSGYCLKDCFRRKGTINSQIDPRYWIAGQSDSPLGALGAVALRLLHPGATHTPTLSVEYTESLCARLPPELSRLLQLLTSPRLEATAEAITALAQSLIDGGLPESQVAVCDYCGLRIYPLDAQVRVCGAHVYCSSECTQGTGSCQECQPRRKRLIVVKKTPPVCAVCGTTFTLQGEDVWRLQLLGSSVAARANSVCSQECMERLENAELTQELDRVQKELIHIKETMEELNLKRASDISSHILTINGHAGCHFCKREYMEPGSCRLIACGSFVRVVCSLQCLQSLEPTASGDYECPTCADTIELRRFQEALALRDFQQSPKRTESDCALCYRSFELKLKCGHAFCHQCYDRMKEGKKVVCKVCQG